MRASIGRFDNSKVVEATDGQSVASVLSANGFSKAENEVIQDLNGNEYDGTEAVEDGGQYFLVQRTKSGQE